VASLGTLKTARAGSAEMTFIDPDLGLGRLDASNHPTSVLRPGGETVYWTAIAGRTRALVQSFKPQITQLMLTGSSASDPRFKATIKDAVQDVVAESALEMLLDDDKADNSGEIYRGQVADLVFANAKGAAEFAKRRQEGPVRCVESEECKLIRGKERLVREETDVKPEL